MGISSLGVGSGILTQDILDQLRKADEAQRIRPITLELANENDMSDSFGVLSSTMKNFRDASNELQNGLLFNERKATVDGTSVSVSASSNSDVQDFTLDVTQLATKEIDESGSYDSKTAKIASDSGSIKLSVGSDDFTIDYDANTTVDDLRKAINNQAGDKVQASIVQVSDGDFRLFLQAKNSGDLSDSSNDGTTSDQSITITDNDGNLNGKQLTDDYSKIQDGLNSVFKYNGQEIVRGSNEVDDLVTGYKISLKELGKSDVSVAQNREEIDKRVDSFVEKYNSIIDELTKLTKSSTNSKERGIFSGESGIKAMKTDIRNLFDTISNVGGNLQDYGFDIDRDGKMSVDKTVLHKQLDKSPSNVAAFFGGGDYKDADGNVTTIATGAFTQFYDLSNGYVKHGGELSLFKDNIDETIKTLEERKTDATKQLDSKYEILKKKYTAFNAIINKLNNASNVFTQLANQQLQK